MKRFFGLFVLLISVLTPSVFADAPITPVVCDDNVYVTFDYTEANSASVVQETIILDGTYTGTDFNIVDLTGGDYRVALKENNDVDGTITFTNAIITSGPTSDAGTNGLEGADVMTLVGQNVLDFELLTTSGRDRVLLTLAEDPACDTVPVLVDDEADVDQNGSVNTDVLANDDLGYDGISTLTIETSGTNGSATINDNGTPEASDDTIDYVPNVDFFGTDSFVYEVCDEDDDCSTATVSVTVALVPQVCDESAYITFNYYESNSDTTVSESFVFTGTFTGDHFTITDLGGNEYEIAMLPGNVINGSITFTNVVVTSGPTYDDGGHGLESNDSVILSGPTVLGVVLTANPNWRDEFTVTLVDDPICDPDAQDDIDSVLENSSVNIDVLANDSFGLQGPNVGSISIVTGAVTGVAIINAGTLADDPTDDTIDYTPAADFTGTDTFTYEICDANGDCDTAEVEVEVYPLAPAVCDDVDYITFSYYERNNDVTVNKTVVLGDFENDHIILESTDPDEYRVTIKNGFDVEGTFTLTNTVVVNGPLYEIGGDGIEPSGGNGDFVQLSSDTVIEMDLATNGLNGIDQFTIDVAADPVCDPDTQDDSSSVVENASVNIDVLDNDTFGLQGPNGGAITITSGASDGFADVNDNGTPSDPTDDSVDYTPSAFFVGSDAFTYQICDDGGDCDDATVDVTVTPLTPVVCDDNYYVTFDYFEANSETSVQKTILLSGTYVGDHFNIVDLGGDDYRVALKENNDVDGTITFTNAIVSSGLTEDAGANGLEGADIMTLTGQNVLDFELITTTGRDRVLLTLAEDPACDGVPVAEDDDAQVQDNMSVNIQVLVNDNFGVNGPNGSAIVVTVDGINGSAVVNDGGTPSDPADDTVDYTPNPDFVGEDTFTYQICDEDDDCDTAEVTVEVFTLEPVACDGNVYVTFDYDETWSSNTSVSRTALLANAYTSHFTMTDQGTGIYEIAMLPGNKANGTISLTNGVIIDGPDYASGGHGLESNDVVSVDDEYTISFDFSANINWEDRFTVELLDYDPHCTTPTAQDDILGTNQDTPASFDVLGNDDFGVDTPKSGPIEVTVAATHGSAIVNDAGTPTDPTDDSIDYTPTPGYYGDDSFTYEICDIDDDCETADVSVSVYLVPQVCDAYRYLTFDYHERNTDTIVSESIVLTTPYENDHIRIELTDTDEYTVTIKNGFDVEGSFSFTNAVIASGPSYVLLGDGIEPDAANGDYVFASSNTSLEMDLATNGAGGIDQFTVTLADDIICTYGGGGGGGPVSSSTGGGDEVAAQCASVVPACTQSASNDETACSVGVYSDLDDTSSVFRWMCTSGDSTVTCQSDISNSCEDTTPTVLLDTGAGEEGEKKQSELLNTGPVGFCGDHQFNPELGEQCDDGNNLNFDGCNQFCQLDGFCGDGKFDAGEQCDDGNNLNNDGCNQFCQLDPGYCGDRTVDPGEQCDDGNSNNFDGCNQFCQLER